MKHQVRTSCESGCGYCHTCTLDFCDACCTGEGSMPTHCPGEKVSWELDQRISAGEIDFRDGEWHEGIAAWRHSIEDGYKNELKYLKIVKSKKPLNLEAYARTKAKVDKYKDIIRENMIKDGY